MNNGLMGYLIIFFVAIIALMLIKSMRSTKELRRDSEYVNTYIKVLKNEDNAYDILNDYINRETDSELVNKAKIVKVYKQLENDENPTTTINEIDFDELLNVPVEDITKNSDMFVWLVLNLSKARSKSMIDIMNVLYDKVIKYDNNLKNVVEYRVFKAGYESMLEKGYEGIEFLKQLLLGEYKDFSYDKQLIGVFKKFAASILVYTGEPLSDEYDDMLKDFAVSQVGNRFMKHLNIIDKYYQEKKEEENKEEIEQKQ